jgi:nucleoside-diphosphate-sugar epimerase
VNVVWQGYANEVTLRALRHATPDPFVLNLTGPEILSVRQVAQRFAEVMGKDLQITGTEAASALLSNASKCMQLFGYPDVTPLQMIDWITAWLQADLPLLNKPTGFQKRDGKF